jgi:hypothetical protein
VTSLGRVVAENSGPALTRLRVRCRLSSLRSIQWGVVDQAVEDGIGIGGVADQRVPLIDGELAGDDGGPRQTAYSCCAWKKAVNLSNISSR